MHLWKHSAFLEWDELVLKVSFWNLYRQGKVTIFNSLSCSALSTAPPLINCLFLSSSMPIWSKMSFTCCSNCRTKKKNKNLDKHLKDSTYKSINCTFSVKNLYPKCVGGATHHLLDSPEEGYFRTSILEKKGYKEMLEIEIEVKWKKASSLPM